MAQPYVASGLALDKGIETLAELAVDPKRSADNALLYAQAANQLAEALAWLRAPGQPHGGGSHASS